MKQLGVQYSYTLEASVCGTLTGSDSSLVHTHFNVQDYQDMGKTFCETLADFFNPHPTKVSLFLFTCYVKFLPIVICYIVTLVFKIASWIVFYGL